ncbi:hypothetical protein, partial [Klebsiella pneumoniae]|uniref:hypothetical protein n=1 Tax=Klebsiella pneumoniae TaxID=573 RepID=UPI00405583A1
RPHVSRVTSQKLLELGYETLSHTLRESKEWRGEPISIVVVMYSDILMTIVSTDRDGFVELDPTF